VKQSAGDVTKTLLYRAYGGFSFGPDGQAHRAFLLDDATCAPLEIEVKVGRPARRRISISPARPPWWPPRTGRREPRRGSPPRNGRARRPDAGGLRGADTPAAGGFNGLFTLSARCYALATRPSGVRQACAAFLAYRGEPVFLADHVCAPAHSLVHQSLHATEAKTEPTATASASLVRGARGAGPLPRDPPAWSDENLKSLCAQVRSRLFFAMCGPPRAPRAPGRTATPLPMAGICSCITARSAAITASSAASRG
jgi:hypothetical protein